MPTNCSTIQPIIEVVLVCDGTGSMSVALTMICDTMAEFIGIASILGIRVRLCYYRDFDAQSAHSNVGGYCLTPEGASYDDLQNFVKLNNRAIGGGRWPEAQKTCFEMLTRQDASPEEVTRVIVHFTDAPPHGLDSMLDDEGRKERQYFEKQGWNHADWSGLSARVTKSAHVITFSYDNSYDHMGVNLGFDGEQYSPHKNEGSQWISVIRQFGR